MLTVITPTTGRDELYDAVKSVQGQDCKHLVVIDGAEYFAKTALVLEKAKFSGDVIALPENTGFDGYLCHRIYSAIPSLVNTQYISFLDEDNWYEPDYVETMLKAMEGYFITTCRRNVYTEEKEFICVDNFESIGWNGKYHLYDTNTMMFDRELWVHVYTSSMYGKWDRDRHVSKLICSAEDHYRKHITRPLVNYRSPERFYNFFRKGVV